VNFMSGDWAIQKTIKIIIACDGEANCVPSECTVANRMAVRCSVLLVL
jgi:hypothetical protein